MSIKFGLKTQKIFLGIKEIIKVYKGNKKVYEKALLPARYVQTTVEDFDENGDYTGTAEYIILPKDKPDGYNIVNLNVKGVATNGDYLTDASNMFQGNSSLYLELDYLDTSKVTDMSGMFGQSQATTLDLSNFDTSSVTDMGSMFDNAKATSLDLSSFDTSNVTYMSFMFYYSKATILDLSSFDTSSITDMFDMDMIFYGAQTTIGYARTQADADKFNNSYDKPSTLTFVVMPERYVQTTSIDFDESGDYIGTEEYIILPADKPSGYRIRNINVKGVATKGDYLTNTSDMFYGNPSLYLELDYLNTSNVTTMNYMFGNSQATTLDVSSFDTSKVTNMSSMFQGSQATTLDVSSFDTSKVTNMSSMFWNSKATILDLSSFNTSNVTRMDNMFYNSQATTHDLSNFDTSKVTNMSSMFRGSQATTIDLSSFDTSNVLNMSSMFEGSQATTLDLSSFDTSKVTNVNWMFRNAITTTGYARTQTDADKFNSSLNKPSTLTFVVK